MSILSKKHFHSVPAAFEHLEKILWAGEPVCPHCGTINNATKLQGKSTRPGLWKCKTKECRKQFTVTVGTVFESRHIPLPKMLQAVYLMASSKKGVSSHHLHRILEIQYKSAWFLAHRIREAMRNGSIAPMGGEGKIVEADETFLGQMEGRPRGRRGTSDKRKILTLVERNGTARSFHVTDLRMETVGPIVRNNIAHESRFMTDEAKHYVGVGMNFREHLSVEHSAEEYVRGDAHVNTAEGFFSIFKRGMKGIYQHCGEKHLHRYLAEFDFRYNNRVARGIEDQERAANALRGIVGKRLTYRVTDRTSA